MLRARDTDTLSVQYIDDSSGSKAWTERLRTTVEAYPPGTMSSGGTERTRAGVITSADMIAVTSDRQANDIVAGEDHALLDPADAGESPTAFVVERVRDLPGRYRTTSEWEIHLTDLEGGSLDNYDYTA